MVTISLHYHQLIMEIAMAVNNPILTNSLIIDGSYMIHRSLKVENIYNLMDKKGRRTGGIMQFFRILAQELDLNKGFPLICLDAGLSPYRLAIYPNYKNQLGKAEDNERYEKGEMTAEEKMRYEAGKEYLDTYRFTRNTIKDILDQLKIPYFYSGGMEGDDFMLACKKLSRKSIIVTDDKDLIQLADDNCQIRRPIANELVTKSYFEDNGYLNEHHYVWTKAILGDGSDNIPKVGKGLGAVNAKKITKILIENPGEAGVNLIYSNKAKAWQTFNVDDFNRNLKLVNLLEFPTADLEEIVKQKLSSQDSSPDFNELQIRAIFGEYDIKSVDFPTLHEINMMKKLFLV